MHIEFQITIEGDSTADDPLIDEVELADLLDHTRAQVTRQVSDRLGDLRCEEHDSPPRVIVSGTYSRETEQLDLAYHIDACCQRLLLRSVAALNR
jgi:hypothetical protein